MPTKVGIALVGGFLVMQVVGEILEFKGKVVPEGIKIRKYFSRKKNERKQEIETLQQVQALLNEVNQHYSQDNITKRNEWMNWVNSRAAVYDASVTELTELKEALAANNELTLDLYINVNRNRIIDFASKIINENTIVSREEFTRIFKVYNDYESILKKHNRTNGEVDIAYQIIIESYEEHMKHHTFLEDVRGYTK
jgi:hypothetical protein